MPENDKKQLYISQLKYLHISTQFEVNTSKDFGRVKNEDMPDLQ